MYLKTIMILPFNQASFLFPAVSSPNFAIINCIDSGAPNVNFREISQSEDDLRSRIFGTFVVKFYACLPLLGLTDFYPKRVS